MSAGGEFKPHGPGGCDQSVSEGVAVGHSCSFERLGWGVGGGAYQPNNPKDIEQRGRTRGIEPGYPLNKNCVYTDTYMDLCIDMCSDMCAREATSAHPVVDEL